MRRRRPATPVSQEEDQRHVKLLALVDVPRADDCEEGQQRVEDEHRDAEAVGAEGVVHAEVEVAEVSG